MSQLSLIELGNRKEMYNRCLFHHLNPEKSATDGKTIE